MLILMTEFKISNEEESKELRITLTDVFQETKKVLLSFGVYMLG